MTSVFRKDPRSGVHDCSVSADCLPGLSMWVKNGRGEWKVKVSGEHENNPGLANRAPDVNVVSPDAESGSSRQRKEGHYKIALKR